MPRFIALLIGFLLLFAFNGRGAVLSGKFYGSEPGTTVDLTSVGAVEWVHHALYATNSDRTIGVTTSARRLKDIVVVGTNALAEVTNPVAFSWTNGTPVLSASNVLTSVGITGLTNALSVNVDVNTSLYKLRVYAGAVAAQATLELKINDGVTPAFIDASLDSFEQTNGYYLVDLAMDRNADILSVKLTTTGLYDPTGYVTLQAIALTTNAAPTVAVTGPTNEANVVINTPAHLSALPFDSDGTITNVEFFVGDEIKVGQATNAPFEILWTPTNVGPQTVIAVATDHNGAQTESLPISFVVVSTNGALLNNLAVAPTSVNLTAEGTSDWVHWGVYTGDSVDRRTGVVPQIEDVVLIGSEPAYNFWDNTTGFTWTDGEPNLVMTATPTGIYVVGVSNGFQLTLPADPNPRTLKLYVGTYGALGKLTATLSDYSAPVFIDRSIENVGNGPAMVYTFDYASALTDQTLTVTFTCERMHDLAYGNVTLQAATLVSTMNPLSIAVTSPTNNTIFSAPANAAITANLIGGDGQPRTVEFYHEEETKLGEATNSPYVFNWNTVPPGEYSVFAVTTNNLGIVQTSDPVRFFVVGSGGLLDASFSPSSGSVNLTTEGTADWVHWGLEHKSDVDRKANVPEQISDFTEIGSGLIAQYADNKVSFNWSDGDPTLEIPGTTTGVFVNELDTGFEITVTADQTPRRLKIYVGLFAARGSFEASLSDSSAPPYIHTAFQNIFNNATAVYTIDFAAASPGQTLIIRYTSDTLFDEDWGNITLQAATLRSIAPVVSSISSTPTGTSFNFSTDTGWNYVVETTDSLSPPNWVPIFNQAGTGSAVQFDDTATASSSRFYRVKVSK